MKKAIVFLYVSLFYYIAWAQPSCINLNQAQNILFINAQSLASEYNSQGSSTNQISEKEIALLDLSLMMNGKAYTTGSIGSSMYFYYEGQDCDAYISITCGGQIGIYDHCRPEESN